MNGCAVWRVATAGETCLGVWPPYRQQADSPVQTRQEADGVDPPPGSGVVSQHPHPFLTHTTFLHVLVCTYYRRIPGFICISKARSSFPPLSSSFLFLLSLFEEHLFLCINIFLLHTLPFHLNCKQPNAIPLCFPFSSAPHLPSTRKPVPLTHGRHYSPFLPFNSIHQLLPYSSSQGPCPNSKITLPPCIHPQPTTLSKRLSIFPVPSRDVTDQTLPG